MNNNDVTAKKAIIDQLYNELKATNEYDVFYYNTHAIYDEYGVLFTEKEAMFYELRYFLVHLDEFTLEDLEELTLKMMNEDVRVMFNDEKSPYIEIGKLKPGLDSDQNGNNAWPFELSLDLEALFAEEIACRAEYNAEYGTNDDFITELTEHWVSRATYQITHFHVFDLYKNLKN